MATQTTMHKRTDLTVGPIGRKLMLFALPIIAGNIIMQLYNVADSIIVGQFVGSDALAAVTVSMPIMMLFNTLFMSLSMGANILIAQYRGAGDTNAVTRAVHSTFSLSFITGAIITALGLLLSKPLLHLLGTPDNILDESALYLMIVFLGTVGNILYMLCNGVSRGLGDSRWPLYSLTFSSILNVILDLWFVISFGWGVAGVAIATAVAHIISGLIMLIRHVQGKYGYHLTLSGMLRIDKHIMFLTFKLGIPTAIQNGAMSLGMVVIQSMANNFGSNYIAANGIIQRVDGFAMMPMMGLGMAITTFVGQNTGAGNMDRVKKGTYTAIQMIVAIAAVMGFAIYHYGIYLMRAFTDNQLVLDMGLRGLHFIAFFFFFMGVNQTVSGTIRGAGEANVPAVLAIINTVIRIPFAYWLAIIPFNRDIAEAVSAGLYATRELAKAAGVGQGNYMGLFYSMGISMVCGAAMVLAYFMFGNWQSKSIVSRPAGDASSAGMSPTAGGSAAAPASASTAAATQE
ncbi:MAG: MATE family efflux transporter [Clostridiales bacterium]|nr:MATE family efflux transporter [Clostridiales bacterium]